MFGASNAIETDGVVIIGAGIAGLFTALALAPFPVLLLCAERPGASGSSAWAQGGLAAAVGPSDGWQSHAEDTLRAGAGLGDPEVATFVAREAPERIEDLSRLGVALDHNPDGSLALAREAAHSHSRIVHVQGDRAGAEISSALARAALSRPSISVAEGMQALQLATRDGEIVGVFARRGRSPESPVVFVAARRVVIATGGIGALYAVTTNPRGSRGEGVGMAARAGALIADAEFVQFHPTAIALGRDPAPLATEALRGEGSILVNENGCRFMPEIHPDAELAPRDVVARAIHREIASGHRAYLDCRAAVGERFAQRFPTVDAACRSAGIDPALQPIPVAPAAHYHMGGIASDHHGRSSLSGLWSVGECASTGLHGANRLASNSLTEALVFGARVAKDIRNSRIQTIPVSAPPGPEPRRLTEIPQELRDAMSRGAGLERDADGLREAWTVLSRIGSADPDPSLLNASAAATLILSAALARRESIGAHYRTDGSVAAAQPARTLLTLEDAKRIASDRSANPRATAVPTP